MATQLKNMYLAYKRTISVYKQKQNIKKTHFKFLVVFPICPLGFCVKNIL